MATDSITLSGSVKRVEDLVKISDNFEKRVIVITIDEDTDYPQDVAVEFVNDKCQYLSKYSEGDFVNIDINIRGKDFEKDDKVMNFTKLNGWRIKGNASGGGATADASDMPGAAPEPQAAAPAPADAGADDLPF